MSDEIIKLTKSQEQLMSYWDVEVKAIIIQFANAVNMLRNEIRKNQLENFAEEHKLTLSDYQFNPQKAQFEKKGKPS